MPGMHGADLASLIRQRHPELPIVFVTGYAQSDQLEAALGADVPVLRKPFTVAQLAAMVSQHLPAKG
jgi:CheY-like chemotaxis protein